MHKLRGITLPGWVTAIVLFIVGFVTFGLLASDLGFYWDDWSKTLVNVLYGFEGYAEYYAADRPLSGWTHILFVSLIGNKQFNWQILNIILRTLSAIAIWWSLKVLWPQNQREISLAAILYLVLPIFTQQPAAVTFHQQWLQAALYFFALGITLRSLNSKRWYIPLTLLAILLNGLQLTVTEYFFGLVLIIPLFIGLYFYLHNFRGKAFRKKTFLFSLPYIALSILFALWRFVWMQLPVEDPYALTTFQQLLQQPLQTSISLAQTIFLDILEVLIGSWAPVFDLSLQTASQPSTLFSWALSFLVALFVIIFLFTQKEPKENEADFNNKHWIAQLIGAGFIMLFFGILPAWAIGKNVLLDFHANRYAMPAMAGIALMLIGIFSWFIQNWERKIVVLGIFIGLAAGFHLREVNAYRWNWSEQSDFYWQLYWRAPKIQSKTAIVFEEDPFPTQGLFSTSSALNLLYTNNRMSGDLPYWAYAILPRFAQSETFPANQHLSSTFRSLHFEGNTDDMILTHYNPSHGKCWWILSGDDQLNPYLSPQERQWAAASNLNRISNDPSVPTPDADLFGEEPDHNWCYFYEKAELCIQEEDWQTAVDLGNQAQEMGYRPELSASSNSPREWIPFILGYGMANELEMAFDLTQQSYTLDSKYQPMLCAAWDKILPLDENDPWREKINNALDCTTTWNSLSGHLER
jgi:hypothetical protein